MKDTTGTEAEAEEAVPAKLELTVDEVIEGHVGSLGWSQLVHVLLVSLAWIFDSQNTLATIFSDAQPREWRCATPSSNACQAAREKGAALCSLSVGTWEWVGGHRSSIVAEWGLICDRKFLAAVPASVFFIGSLLGSGVFGYLADTYLGRKKTVFVSCLFTFVTALLTSFSPNIWVYSLLRFSNGFARSGIGICCLVLATEVVGRKWRGQVGQYGFFFFTVGFISMPFIGYATKHNWRNLYRIISLFPLGYSLLLFPFISESPRWLLIKGRNKEALDILKKFARLNGKELSADITLVNPTKGEGELETKKEENLWKTKWAAKRMIIVMLSGLGVGFVYYGIQLNVENLNFNLYLTVGLNALMEIPAVFIGSVFLGFTSRRLLFSLSAYVAGIACLFCIIFSHGKRSWPQLVIELVGFMASSTAYDVIYIYCAELFPTNVRNFAVSMLRQALMLGASLAPLLVGVGRQKPSLSFLIFGVVSILSGVLSIWLRETKDVPLCETLKQQKGEEEKSSSASTLSNCSCFKHGKTTAPA